jgi:hypothetical protein
MLFGAGNYLCRWGRPKRRTALVLGADVKLTSVRFGSALPAEVDASASTNKTWKLTAVAITSVILRIDD